MGHGVIYVATNTVTGKQYVGLTTVGVIRRWSNHVTHSRSPKTYLHKAIAKYGASAFCVEEYATAIQKEFLAQLEKNIILQLAPAYNQTHGGEVTFGRKYDDATKNRIRLSNIGQKRTAEQRERNRIQKIAWFAANPQRKEVAAKKLAEARLLVDEEKRAKAAGESAKNRVWSDESRAKLSASCKGRKYGPDIIAKMVASKKRKVVCVQTEVVYPCAADAAAVINAHKSSVNAACKHGRKVYGFNFKYVE